MWGSAQERGYIPVSSVLTSDPESYSQNAMFRIYDICYAFSLPQFSVTGNVSVSLDFG